MQAAALFPSPSSGFVPTQDEESFRDILDSRVAKQQQRQTPLSSSTIAGSTPDDADKENAFPMSRTSSSTSLKQQTGVKQRRRSSAAHPLSPSSSALRSRPGSFSNSNGGNGSTSHYIPSTLSGKSSRRNSSYSLASSSCDPNSSSNSNSNNNSSVDFSPAFANMALPEDSALQIDEDEEDAPAMSISPKGKESRMRSGSGNSKKNNNGKRRSRRISNEDESEASDTIPVTRSSKRLSNARSVSTLVPGRNVDAPTTDDGIHKSGSGWELTLDEPENGEDWTEQMPVVHVVPVKIRDFGFPSSDPRYRGELPAPDTIQLPSASSSSNGYNPYSQSWYDSTNSTTNPAFTSNNGFLSIATNNNDSAQDPSMSILSSSSSSSLSSSFTPPPIGSFGFGHHYHYAGNAPTQSSHARNSSQSQSRTEWSTWGNSPSTANSPKRRSTQQENQTTSPTTAPGQSKYSWNFVTDNTPQGQEGENDSSFTTSSNDTAMPSALLGSALNIDDFEDDFEDDDEEEDGREEGDTIPSGGLLYRAAYPFSAEAPQEMGLTEGDLVRVYEKLCDGWVVGTKITLHGQEERETGENGLIPENYLSLAEDLLHPETDADSAAEGPGDRTP